MSQLMMHTLAILQNSAALGYALLKPALGLLLPEHYEAPQTFQNKRHHTEILLMPETTLTSG